MPRWQDTQSSSHQPSSPSYVNNFAIHSPIGPFHGAGRCRTIDRSVAAKERRDDSVAIAEKLVQGGLGPDEVYLAPADIADIMLAIDGSNLRDNLGRPRRAWVGFPDHAHALKTRVGREYAVFAAAHGIDQVIQVVVRPPDSTIDLTDLASRHAQDSETLTAKLRYARKTRAASFAWDLVSAEIKNVGNGGWIIDSHFHLSARGVDDNALERIQKYFVKRGWTFWFRPSDHESAGRHPIALAQYQSKGVAAAIGDGTAWTPEALAELRRQTRHLAMVRATGSFRTWKSEVVDAGLAVVEDVDGRPMLAPKRVVTDRPRRKLRQTCSFIVVKWCVHDFGDGLSRRAIRTRGHGDVSLSDVSAVYDLTDIYKEKESAAIPKFSPSTPSTFHPSSASDPPEGDPPPDGTCDKIPW